MFRISFCLVLVWLVLIVPGRADDQDRLKVGVQPDGRILVPTNQLLKPAGKQVLFPGRPVDLALLDEGRTVVAKSMRGLVFIDVARGEVTQTLALPTTGSPKPGFSVVGLLVVGERVLATDAQNQIRVAKRDGNGQWRWESPIPLAKPAVGGLVHPAGLVKLDDQTVLVASTRGNNIQRVDLANDKVVDSTTVGVAPYTLRLVGTDRAYVSNWGGDPPKPSEPQAKSSETPIRIDPKTGVANSGSVSVLQRTDGSWKQTKTIAVGLHPSGLATSRSGRFVYVANANSDSVSVIDTSKDAVVETISCRPEARLPFGSGSNALVVGTDGGTLYVANGTNNCIAVVRLGRSAREDGQGDAKSQILGLIPTGWYPGAVLLSPDGKKLFVANIKGHGSLSQPRPEEKGKNSHDHLGSLSIIDLPDAAQLAKYTAEVVANNRVSYSLNGLAPARPEAKPVPLPERHGEPSVFQHVFYIIKENRTYDQVFGDMKEGNGEPKLTIFGEKITPNHHALARQFTLFDNFYCSGVLSADGHTWTNEAYVGDYLEKSFGGFTRSYPDDGSDPLAYAEFGFLWDNALARKRTVRNYGEYVEGNYAPKGTSWTDFYSDYKNGTQKVKWEVKPNKTALAPFTHPRYPWFPLLMPDVYRARIFMDELKEFEKKGDLPNLIYLTLPCDHTEGTTPGFPTPRAMVADNDLALGQIIEAITRSRFWPKTCIFVVEDDPQNGYDHVDGHRTVALVISPYTKRKYVDHTNYNQTGMVKSIELMLGLPPMNQLDLSATPMRHCFQDKPDLTPYVCLPNQIPLDEMNPELKSLKGKALYWARKSMELNLEEGDKADEDTLNRILWHATRGYDTPYPEEYTRKVVED